MKSKGTMTIPFLLCRRCVSRSRYLFLLAALYLLFSHVLRARSFWLTVAAYTVIGFLAFCGVLLQILLQKGVVRFSYTDADKETAEYKARMMAEDMQLDLDQKQEARERKMKDEPLNHSGFKWILSTGLACAAVIGFVLLMQTTFGYSFEFPYYHVIIIALVLSLTGGLGVAAQLTRQWWRR